MTGSRGARGARGAPRLDAGHRMTPEQADELARLLRVAREQPSAWSLSWVAREYERRYRRPPPPAELHAAATPDELADEYDRLRVLARERGYRSGWAALAYLRLLGRPPRARREDWR